MEILSAEFVVSNTDYKQGPKTLLPEYAFIGRSNVGKSSLINMLTGHKKLAKTSGTPGKTQLINHFLINKAWYIVDLPGYGYAKVSKSQRKKFQQFITDFLTKREQLISIFVLLDARLPPQQIDIDFMNWCGEKKLPFAIVFTKIDKISSSVLNKNMQVYKKELLRYWEDIPPVFTTSSEAKLGREKILHYIGTINKQVNH